MKGVIDNINNIDNITNKTDTVENSPSPLAKVNSQRSNTFKKRKCNNSKRTQRIDARFDKKWLYNGAIFYNINIKQNSLLKGGCAYNIKRERI